ncbi:DnaJ C-terminal domain-containing protein [Cyanobacterium sp. IPPAS B-1200]|uniref:DnaJ C-terminal domain-containing protein n=1 Tax=Cyanobacterium sp. IPPAS B-1200 TaxID=1562720 RepID=UPI0008527EBA|nr:J domain-containing protein [Cyanobacterium sp. IPPAS B-1200]OEJ78467.1 molecular chaperone DnaJ [Cyanobacterium sp. IPPAS B-1200]
MSFDTGNLRTTVNNYYQILGVEPSATLTDIKKEFRTLARRYHPDLNPGDKSAEEMFKKINEAYDTLSDDTKRSQYDLLIGNSRRRVVRPKSNNSSGFPFTNINTVWDDLRNNTKANSPRGNVSDNSPSNYNRTRPTRTEDYQSSTAKRIKSVPPRPKSKDIEAKLSLPLEKAYLGGRERIRLEDGRSLEIDMPPAMYHGQKIRLKGQGIRGGDLYLKILIEEHPFFKLQKTDISCEIPLTPAEAIVGGAIEIPTIDGLVKMNVPSGVKSGQRLKLADKGYPNIRGERGDQMVILRIVPPNQVSDKEKELYKQIREIETFNPRQDLLDYYQ